MTEANISTGKTCSNCKIAKSSTEFFRDKNRPDGLFPHCKACSKVRQALRYAANKPAYAEAKRIAYQKDKEAVKARAKKWAQENPAARRATSRRYVEKNPEVRYATQTRNRLANPGMYAAHFKMRQQRLKNALPKWADLKAIEAFYIESARITKETGVKHHVDHFYPLTSDIVCGLHNEFNLRVIPAKDNLSKANSFPED